MNARRLGTLVAAVAACSIACDSSLPPRDAGSTTCLAGDTEPCACLDASLGTRRCDDGAWSACGPCLGTDAGADPRCGDGSCDAGESCASCTSDCGACPACGPGTCAGCCDLDACVTGVASTACGEGGERCTACPPAFLCAAGECAVDPASRWNVVLEALTVATTNTRGEAWDALGGAPDPFVEIRVESESALPIASGSGSDNFSVVFSGEPTVTDVRASQLLARLDFTVWDLDTTVHDFVGRCVFAPLDPVAFLGGTQTLDCAFDAASMNAGFTLTWRLERF